MSELAGVSAPEQIVESAGAALRAGSGSAIMNKAINVNARAHKRDEALRGR
jgi:hypothetical protein